MDNPNGDVKKTKKFGKTLYAKSNIKKSELIADWTKGKVYTAKKSSLLPNDPPDFVEDHAIQFAENKYIDYNGIGRYFSHSCNPNCGFRGKFKIIAMRNIKAGELLTFDYEMSEDSDWKLECKCRSKNCRKVIGAFKNMPKEIRNRYNGHISSWLRKKYKMDKGVE